MRLFQAALDTCLDSPCFASLSVHGLHFTVYAPSNCPHIRWLVFLDRAKKTASAKQTSKIAAASEFLIANSPFARFRCRKTLKAPKEWKTSISPSRLEIFKPDWKFQACRPPSPYFSVGTLRGKIHRKKVNRNKKSDNVLTYLGTPFFSRERNRSASDRSHRDGHQVQSPRHRCVHSAFSKEGRTTPQESKDTSIC